MITQAQATAFACFQLATLAQNTQATATAFACSQLATLARNTQAPATAFACSQLATLAQKKRCLGTATQSLGVFVRCRLPPSALVPAPYIMITASR